MNYEFEIYCGKNDKWHWYIVTHRGRIIIGESVKGYRHKSHVIKECAKINPEFAIYEKGNNDR
jgi:uncharacterized protein YegP (UPF0339 family)